MENKQKEINDINFIKEAIDKTKKNNHSIKKIFLLYGSVNILLLIVSFLVSLVISDLSKVAILSLISSLLGYVIITASLFYISTREKNHTNIFFRVFISMFFFVAVLIPLILLLMRAFVAFIDIGSPETLFILNQMSEFLMIFIFSISLMIVGKTNESRIFNILSILNVITYLLLFLLNTSLGSNQFISAQYSSLYYGIVTSIGYILLTIFLSKNKGD